MLMDADVRSYQDKNHLCVQAGQPGMLDDAQVEAAKGGGGLSSAMTGGEDVDMEDKAGISLWDEE